MPEDSQQEIVRKLSTLIQVGRAGRCAFVITSCRTLCRFRSRAFRQIVPTCVRQLVVQLDVRLVIQVGQVAGFVRQIVVQLDGSLNKKAHVCACAGVPTYLPTYLPYLLQGTLGEDG